MFSESISIIYLIIISISYPREELTNGEEDVVDVDGRLGRRFHEEEVVLLCILLCLLMMMMMMSDSVIRQ